VAVGGKVIRLEGMAELQAAFRLADKGLSKDLRAAFQSAAEPVRQGAEALAVSRIRRIGVTWSRMRVGITRTSVYVAPRQRGVTSKVGARARRPNLAPLLLDRAMEPALDANREKVMRETDDALRDLARTWSRV